MSKRRLPIEYAKYRARHYTEHATAWQWIKPGVLRADFSNGCLFPRQVEQVFDTPYPGWKPGQEHRVTMEVAVRCRKCPNCLDAKADHWAIRAQRECAKASRTWFCTFTVKGTLRHQIDTRCRVRDKNFDALGPDDQFRARVSVLRQYFTRYFKRVRKGHRLAGEKPVTFRYLLVSEHHKDGYPHFHALIHEKNNGEITQRRIRKFYTLGISEAKLAGSDRAKTARYVCKYISKDSRNRPWASLHYGDLSIYTSSPTSLDPLLGRHRGKRGPGPGKEGGEGSPT